MTGLVVVPVRNHGDWTQVLKLRSEVFVDEQGVPEAHEIGRTDLNALHVLATMDGTPVGTGRLLVEVDGALPEPPDEEAVEKDHLERSDAARLLPRLQPPEGKLRGRIGRMAVAAHARRQGVGKLVLSALEGNAWRMGLDRLVLAAQVSALAFYEDAGYRPIGDRFQEAGIEHQWMEKMREG